MKAFNNETIKKSNVKAGYNECKNQADKTGKWSFAGNSEMISKKLDDRSREM